MPSPYAFAKSTFLNPNLVVVAFYTGNDSIESFSMTYSVDACSEFRANDVLKVYHTAVTGHGSPSVSTTARLFVNGCSQAIRLPAKLRPQADDFMIEPIGDAPWLQPPTAPHSGLGEWIQAFYAGTEPLPPEFLAGRQNAPPRERDWSWRWQPVGFRLPLAK